MISTSADISFSTCFRVRPSEIQSQMFPDIVISMRISQQIKQQQFEVQRRLDTDEASADDYTPESLTKENITEVVRNLEKEIEKLKAFFYNKALLLQRAQTYDVIHNKLSENSTESKLLYKTIDHSKGLCSLLLQSEKEKRDLEEQLIEVRKKRMQLKEDACTIMMQIKTLKENQKSGVEEMHSVNVKKLNKYLAKESDLTTVVQNIFQRVILASRVNWAEDPKLREIVLKLDKSPSS
ncbi:centromere protein H isoform X2 [Mixophyes fleayi]|uniref:centromere protein H isoform X2 n=1 Tax=Mixophyes fleayi TaxID=3061075 RepID=UPI003F4E07F7